MIHPPLRHIERSDDHLAHALHLAAQAVTGLAVVRGGAEQEPELQVADDGIGHSLWVVRDGGQIDAITRAFGFLKEDKGIAYRATVVIDDDGVIRAVSVNDLSVGRSPAEVLRTVQALQSGGLCGVDWHKGGDFVA